MNSKRAKLIGKRQFVIEEVPFPKVNGNPIIKVTHVGVCGSDLHHWEEGNGAEQGGMVLGHEYTGIIEDPGNSGFSRGDRVLGYTQNTKDEPCGWCENCLKGDFDNCSNRTVKIALGCEPEHPGAYSEYITWYPGSIFKLPDNVGSEEAAVIEPAAVALHAVGTSRIHTGDKVLIIGGGIIGLCVAEWARSFGAEKIVMTEVNADKRKRIDSLNIVDRLFAADDVELSSKLEAEAPYGYDLFFDCVTIEEPLNMAVSLLKRGGTGIIIGLNFHPVKVDLLEVVNFQKRLQGSKGHTPDDFRAVMRAIADGRMDLKKYITRRFPLDEVQSQFEDMKRSGNDIKAMICF